MDCVVGKREGKGAVLLVLSERSIREPSLKLAIYNPIFEF